MKSNLISKSETNEMLKDIAIQWKIDLPKIKNLRVHYITDDAQIITAKDIMILKTGNTHLPFLSQEELLEKFPYVMVDMGAVKFMCNGANVMRPGIRKYSEFEKDQIVCVIEESQHKFLAVGKAMVPSSELETMQKGEVVKNLHYISDKFWEIGKTISN
ncbi:MAG TPA: PUA domain-containing protein [Nitrosopumilaceae archaeon]|nr:PUA domain-containing protein [Nitrosopumilaceae archaeon]